MPTTSRRKPRPRSTRPLPRWTSISANTSWRVIHTDCLTPDAFLARLAFDDFEKRPVTIQMALKGDLTRRGASIELRPVATGSERDALLKLVLADHVEGRRPRYARSHRQHGRRIYRPKSEARHFHLAIEDGVPVADGAHAAAPNRVGMIEDLFTLQSARRRGGATVMITASTDRLRASGCQTIFLAAEQPIGRADGARHPPLLSLEIRIRVQARRSPVASFDDPSLGSRKIRVQLMGDDGMNSPPAHALAERGIVGNCAGS